MEQMSCPQKKKKKSWPMNGISYVPSGSWAGENAIHMEASVSQSP